MGIADRTAFPEHLDTREEVENAFPDDDQYGDGWFGRAWRRFNKATKHWNAFGPRSPKGIAFCHWPPFILFRKWREVPVLLYAEKGGGYWRFEADGKEDLFFDGDAIEFLKKNPGYYLSRVQLWCESHQAVQWPLFFSTHTYIDPKDVIPVGTKADRDGKIWNFHIGAKRDADRIFWWIGFFLGRNFK